MISRLILILLLAAAAISISEGATDFPHGPRPTQPVYDPAGVLTPDAAREIAGPLVELRQNDGPDVIVVILPELPVDGPAQAANRIAAEWSDAPIWCVVLAVPGNADSPWIIPSGTLDGRIPPQEIERLTARAHRRAAAQPTEPQKIGTAAQEATEMISDWAIRAKNDRETLLTESVRRQLEREARARQWKIIATFAATAIAIVLGGIAWLIARLRSRQPVYFPPPVWRTRLGGNHAGGNYVVVELKAKS